MAGTTLASSPRCEWLWGNKKGGYAYLPLQDSYPSRYHTYLCAALSPPFGRTNLLAKVEETLHPHSERLKPANFQIKSNGCLSITLRAGGAEVVKEVFLLKRSNSVLITYTPKTYLPKDAYIEVKPFFAVRNHHKLGEKNNIFDKDIECSGQVARWIPFRGFPEVKAEVSKGMILGKGIWSDTVSYEDDVKRGYPHTEQLFIPYIIRVPVEKGYRAYFYVTVDNDLSVNSEVLESLAESEEKERSFNTSTALTEILGRSLSLFITNDMNGAICVPAGFPWFEFRGRDALQGIEGLFLCSGKYREAKQLLQTLGEKIIDGMVPLWHDNALGETSYESVDTSLWYIFAVERYFSYTHDAESVRMLFLEPIQEILRFYASGTINDIHMDPSGLLWHFGGNIPLTWMEVRVKGKPVTPRHGCAIEVNALWYNALKSAEDMCARFGMKAQESLYNEMAVQVKKAFYTRFIPQDSKAPCDVLNPSGNDRSLRPNALFAFSLPYPALDARSFKEFLWEVHFKLVTPVGLRTLTPEADGYIGNTGGDGDVRELAYHNGTAWPHLFTAYWTAVQRAWPSGPPAELLEDLKVFLESMNRVVNVGVIGHLPEFFEGDPPYEPIGAPAQALAEAEVFRLLKSDLPDL